MMARPYAMAAVSSASWPQITTTRARKKVDAFHVCFTAARTLGRHRTSERRTSDVARHASAKPRRRRSQPGSQAMSIFGNIMSTIVGHSSSAQAAPAGSPAAKPAEAPAAGAKPAAPTASASASASPAAPAAPASAGASVDVSAVLTNLAAQKKEKLDWRKSIVDLMKVLDLDSSLQARKQLAQELKY